MLVYDLARVCGRRSKGNKVLFLINHIVVHVRYRKQLEIILITRKSLILLGN